MTHGILEFFRRTLVGEAPIHPIDRRMAKHWIKRRLVAVYPQLQLDPEGLERAYRELSLELQEVEGADGERERTFSLRIPEQG